MDTEYYWKECFGVCLEGKAAKHWLICNHDEWEYILAEVSRPWTGDRGVGLWSGEAFNRYTEGFEILEEAQKATIQLVKQIGKSLSILRINE